MWKCKDCENSYSRGSELLKHYKLDHHHYGRGRAYPCTYENCPCTCKTWKALLTHLSKCHPTQKSPQEDSFSAFKCHICNNNQLSTETDYFKHIGTHLRNRESVECVFNDCSYKTNIYGAFNTHKWRRHNPHTIHDFKTGIVDGPVGSSAVEESFESGATVQSDDDITSEELTNEEPRNLTQSIEVKLASVLLKLEHYFLVPSIAVTELLDELQYLIGTASVPVAQKTLLDSLKSNNCIVDESLVKELATVLCTTNPIKAAVGKGGPLSTAWKRKAYYRKNFNVVEPIEYFLDRKNNKTFQYVPLLKSLQQLLNCETTLNKAIHLKKKHPVQSDKQVYRSFWDGRLCKSNAILSKECAISVILYVDDFEICNPLGTSRKKHKICALYWILGNLPPGCHSSLSSIHLAALINSSDVKVYGYEKVLEPLIADLITLEQHGVFVEKLGKTLKGTLQCVIADNLGAHSIAGFVESFSGSYVCRFCTADRSEIQDKEVGAGAFCLRTEEIHTNHLKTLEENSLNNCFGVKRKCVLSKKLTTFNVSSGFPPDIVHDLFEGIVPVEISLCLNGFISKKFFTLVTLNKAIEDFPYKWTDKTNRPHSVPLTYASRKTIGGNAHENWCLIRFFPQLLGQKVPTDEPAWKLLGDLKDIVEIVVSPVQTQESIAYLTLKISEHRVRFKEVFPESNFRPKHNFLQHYPHLISEFGPLVSLWTMRF